jgi:hypothetical protein
LRKFGLLLQEHAARNILPTEISTGRRLLQLSVRRIHPFRKPHTKPPKWGTESRRAGAEKGIGRVIEAKSKAVRRGADDRTRLINPNSNGTEESTLPSEQSAADRAPPKRRRSAESTGQPGEARARRALGFERVLEGSGGRAYWFWGRRPLSSPAWKPTPRPASLCPLAHALWSGWRPLYAWGF